MSKEASKPTRRKVLIIGLDGATFDVLRPLMEADRLPNMKRAVSEGTSGILHSTVPPITPAAWTTFLTGKQPGSHGVIDFERYDATTHRLMFNSTRTTAGIRNIWQILSDKDYHVGSVNVPLTYPPLAVNGFMISGFETPGPTAEFAYPPELKAKVLQRWSDPTLQINWKRKTLGGEKLFDENVDYMAGSFHQGAQLTTFCGDEYGWDVLMVVLKMVDNLQHKTWRYIDPRWQDRHPRRREKVFQCFEEMDRAVGDLLAYAAKHKAVVIMVSDHGHGSLEGKVQANLLLKQWGYLHLAGGGAQGSTRARKIARRWFGAKGVQARGGDIGKELAVDFSRTQACVMHAGMAGFLYLNLQGRQPEGIVPQEQYETLRDEIRERLLGSDCRVRDPQGKEVQIFIDVHKPEELYNTSREAQPWLPDLMLIPHRPLAVVRKIRGNEPVRWLSYRKIEGTHRPEGIFIATGPGVRQGASVELQMADCAPTILALAGCPVPSDMEGRAVTEVFETPPVLAEESASAAGVTRGDEQVYSEEELAKVTERLADLGYLE